MTLERFFNWVKEGLDGLEDFTAKTLIVAGVLLIIPFAALGHLIRLFSREEKGKA